jgi:beta-aspartyl-peptidase (threonine type)
MEKYAIIIHGGAGPDSEYIKQHQKEYKQGLEEAVQAGYKILEGGGSAVDAVEAAVKSMEDSALFNAGRGGSINAKGEIELCASIISGKDQKSGAVAIVKNVKNPVSLARSIMENTQHIYLGSHGALDYAQKTGIELKPDAYFVTDHAFETYEETRKEKGEENQDVAKEQVNERMHGTVGAVAVDKWGNVAAATSTGGTEYSKEGRIGDSSMIGVGSYANNSTCASSSTGDGEYLIQNVACFHLSSLIEYKGLSLQEACDFLIHEKNKDSEGDMGIISVDPKGNVAHAFNSDRMHRAWMSSDGELHVAIYK